MYKPIKSYYSMKDELLQKIYLKNYYIQIERYLQGREINLLLYILIANVKNSFVTTGW